MGYPLELVSTVKRIDWIKERYNPNDVIYMGDGIFDHYVMKEVAYAIAPANADPLAKSCAHYVCERSGGGRAVAEACLRVMEKFLGPMIVIDYQKIRPALENGRYDRTTFKSSYC